MKTFEQLTERHQALNQILGSASDTLRPGPVINFIAEAREAGSQIADAEQRETLEAMLENWADFVREKTGSTPATNLMPFMAPGAERAAEAPTAVSPRSTAPTSAPVRRSSPPVSWSTIGLLALAAILLALGLVLLPSLLRNLFADNPAEATATSQAELAALAETATAAAVLLNPAPTPLPLETATAVITIIAAETAASGSTAAGGQSYTVQPGDSLFKISQAYGVSMQEIAQANGLINPDQLAVGQTLVIPASGQPAPTAALPTEAAAVPVQATAVGVAPFPLTAQLAGGGQPVTLLTGPGTNFTAVTSQPDGTTVTLIGQNRAGSWYLVQLGDNLTRGWVVIGQAQLATTVNPATIPIINVP